MVVVQVERVAGMWFMGINAEGDSGHPDCSVLNFSLDPDVMNGKTLKVKKFRAAMDKFCLESSNPVCNECRKGRWQNAWQYLQIYM